jgi:FG-GAP repeat
VVSVPDGFVYAVGPTGRRLWRYDYTRGAPKTFASEVTAADLNRDGVPELVFGTYGAAPDSGRLVVLSASGRRLHDIRLRRQGTDGNGIGVPAAPSIADLDGDGRLEIVVSTFDHGIDVFRVPRSGTNRLPWRTGRGTCCATALRGLLRLPERDLARIRDRDDAAPAGRALAGVEQDRRPQRDGTVGGVVDARDPHVGQPGRPARAALDDAPADLAAPVDRLVRRDALHAPAAQPRVEGTRAREVRRVQLEVDDGARGHCSWRYARAARSIGDGSGSRGGS